MMNIDLDKLRIILMPHVLRQGGLLEALFRTAFVPLKRIYADFTAYAAKEEQERIYGPTVKQLRQAIADHLCIGVNLVQFGEVEDRETVDLPRESDGWDMAPKLDNEPVADGPEVEEPLTLWSDDMIWWNREFTVSLPSAYRVNQPEVEAILDRWKMAGSSYTINYY